MSLRNVFVNKKKSEDHLLRYYYAASSFEAHLATKLKRLRGLPLGIVADTTLPNKSSIALGLPVVK